MNWNRIARTCKPAMDDMCRFLSKKYGEEEDKPPGVFEFVFDRKDILVFGYAYMKVSHEDILDYFNHKKFWLETRCEIYDEKVKVGYIVRFLDGRKLYNTDLYSGFDTWKECFQDAYYRVFRAINKRVKYG